MAINDPRDISGLVLWYSAEATTGLADGAQVATWTDLSGNSNDATGASGTSGIKPKWRSAAGASGGAAVEFTAAGAGTSPGEGDGYFILPTNVMGSAVSGEIAITVRAATGVDTGLWSINGIGDGFEGSHYPFGGAVYDCFGLNGSTQRQSFTPTLAITSWRRYNVYSAPGDWQAHLDGVSQKTFAGGTVAWNSAPLLGATSHNTDALALKFQGWMGAVVLYDRKLTPTERADLDSWLIANPSGGDAPRYKTGTYGSGVYGAGIYGEGESDAAPEVVGDLAGSGALTADVVAVVPRGASLTGSGELTASVVQVGVVAAEIGGTGVFTATVVPVGIVAADVAGIMAVTADVEAVDDTPQATAALTGSGVLTADVVAVESVVGLMDGSGEFSAETVAVREAFAALVGSGQFTAETFEVHQVTASLTGTGVFQSFSSYVGAITKGIIRLLGAAKPRVIRETPASVIVFTSEPGRTVIDLPDGDFVVMDGGPASEMVTVASTFTVTDQGRDEDTLHAWSNGEEFIVASPKRQ